MTAAGPPADGEDEREAPAADRPVFGRDEVLSQLGGWRGMVDATVPTLTFVVANGIGGLRAGIWAAVAAAVVVFVLRMVRRESTQQAVSGLFGVAVAVAIAAASGEARNFYAPGIIRNAVIGVVLLGSVLVRWPLVGVVAEFLAPSHLGSLSAGAVPGLRGTGGAVSSPPGAGAAASAPAERHWRTDRRMVRAYSWLTVLWAGTFLLRVAVQGPLYLADEDDLLGVASIALGLPVTAVALLVTLWVVSRLHRHRTPPAEDPAP
ncbi:DUF3159 domain-containing protein [Blastococcus xanthinilyticus]|uniref:Uncharacterized protein DUF3159 n=1 Tax=Blastococcus xanthinilyticus TaxID=1564164 RepID=A0A5S5D5F1_9ACTN|nr:DUF3159 domain-containing protein [Blastococcus xanthinilyticus]TYP90644.1 uncharacterized protein DUF3159 [Blastococcus xanthinilyticus]